MARVLIKEISGVIREKRIWIFMIIMILITLVDLKNVCDREDVWNKRNNKSEIMEMDAHLKEICEKENYVFTSGWIMHPAKAAYLSGSSEGHLTQILLLWLMPIFVLNLYRDRYIMEKKKGYVNILVTRQKKKNCIGAKYIAAFIVPSIVYFICFMVNFVISHIMFEDGYNFNGMEVFAENGGWFEMMYEHPNITYIIYMIITSISAGLCGIICQSIALLTKKMTTTYVVAFFIWMFFIMMKYSITYSMQPFTEYGFEYILKSSCILLVFTFIVTISVFLAKRRRDEL